jgi:hypothetical protein
MGVPNSEVGYASATTRRRDHEVYMDMWWHWGEIKKTVEGYKLGIFFGKSFATIKYHSIAKINEKKRNQKYSTA